MNDIAARQHQPGLKIQAQNGDVLYDSAWTPGVDYESDEEEYDPEEDGEEFDSDAEDSDLEDDDCSTTDEESDSDSEASTQESQSTEDSRELKEILLSEPEEVSSEPRTPSEIQEAEADRPQPDTVQGTVTEQEPQEELRRSSRQPKP